MEFLLTGCTLIDGTGRDPLTDAALHIQDDRIAWVGPQTDLPAEARRATPEDLSGRTTAAHCHGTLGIKNALLAGVDSIEHGSYLDEEIVTRNNARILRWEHELGTLEPGKLADFVVLAGNPLENISNVRKVEAVYKGGEQINIC